MSGRNNPGVSNVVFPGQYSPYFMSYLGTIFYITWLIFIAIAATLYFGKQEGLVPWSNVMVYIAMGAIIIAGAFLADRVQYVFDSQGAIILYPSGVESKENIETSLDTDGKTGSQKGSGVRASYSFWVYDDEIVSSRERFLIGRNFYSDKDLTTVDKDGETVPVNGIIQRISNQPAIGLDVHNHVVYCMQDPSSGDSKAMKRCVSRGVVAKNEWTHVVVIQSQDDVSIYINNRIDKVFTFTPYTNPKLIAKGPIVLFPKIQRSSGNFSGKLSRIYYWNRPISQSTSNKLYANGPIQGTLLYELLKSILGIPHLLISSMFIS